mgnify:CR=1 FL=1
MGEKKTMVCPTNQRHLNSIGNQTTYLNKLTRLVNLIHVYDFMYNNFMNCYTMSWNLEEIHPNQFGGNLCHFI